MTRREQLLRRLETLTGRGADRELDQVRYAIGSLEARIAGQGPKPQTLHDTEFRAFSQFGEDGAIQYLVRQLPGIPTTFVEVGVQDYRESNTRFLAMHDNWAGLAIDGGTAHLDFIRGGETGWRWAVDPVSVFVTAENINQVIAGHGMSGEIGLLSIDVDGVDYWLWDAVSVVRPWIVVVEFNSYFGAEAAVTVPYRRDFDARTAHFSWIYQGASLAALHHLARRKSYRLVGVTSTGINAFFVRDDVAGDLRDLTPEQAYVRTRVRTARDALAR